MNFHSVTVPGRDGEVDYTQELALLESVVAILQRASQWGRRVSCSPLLDFGGLVAALSNGL